MFRYSFFLLVVMALIFSGCDKGEIFGSKEEVYDKSKYFNYENCPICEDGYYQIIEEVKGHSIYYVEPLVVDEQCNCIVKGWLKYVDGKTEAMVDYGSGDCTNWAYKVICENGDCDRGISSTCKFKLGCHGDL